MIGNLLRWFRRQMGWLKGDYLSELDWPQYWDKPRVLVFADNNCKRPQERWQVLDECMAQWRMEMAKHSVNLLWTSAVEDADITVRFGPLAPEHAGHTHAPIGEDRHVRQKTCITLSDQLSEPERILDVALHEFGHALGLNGHSNDSGDVMSVGSRVLTISERDRETLRKCYALRHR